MKKFTFGTPEKLVPSLYCDNFSYTETEVGFSNEDFSFKKLDNGCCIEFMIAPDTKIYGFGLQLYRFEQYGGKITFMGGIDSAKVDYPGWTREVVRSEVRRACDECGKLYFIPCASQGLDISTFEGVYETLSEEIEAYSKEMF